MDIALQCHGKELFGQVGARAVTDRVTPVQNIHSVSPSQLIESCCPRIGYPYCWPSYEPGSSIKDRYRQDIQQKQGQKHASFPAHVSGGRVTTMYIPTRKDGHKLRTPF